MLFSQKILYQFACMDFRRTKPVELLGKLCDFLFAERYIVDLGRIAFQPVGFNNAPVLGGSRAGYYLPQIIYPPQGVKVADLSARK